MTTHGSPAWLEGMGMDLASEVADHFRADSPMPFMQAIEEALIADPESRLATLSEAERTDVHFLRGIGLGMEFQRHEREMGRIA